MLIDSRYFSSLSNLARLIALTLLLINVSGCAYRRMWLPGDGGYSDKAIAPDTYEVVFRGPVYFSYGRCNEYAMLRAAELTLEKNLTHFEILSTKNEDYESTAGSNTSFELKSNGRGGYTNEMTYDPMGTFTVSLPTVRLAVRVNAVGRGYSAQLVRDRVRATM